MLKRKLLCIECAVMISCILIGIVSYVLPFAHGCRDLYDNMLRLHVIANSDSERDQQLKLLVRDTLLREGEAWFDGAADVQTARQRLEPHFADMEQAAKRVLRENGCTDDVRITLEKTFFETRSYGEYTVPAGLYTAMCVRIGNARGHNWWCVMFPPLCLPAATVNTDAAFTSEGKAVLAGNPKYDVRFKVVEWVQKAKAGKR